MNPKNKIKLLEQSIEFVKLLIELKKITITSRFKEPIPEYKKGAKESLFIISDSDNGKETIVTPNGDVVKPQCKNVVLSKPLGSYIYSQEHWDEKLNHILNSNSVVREGGRNSGRTHFHEDWSKQLNEYLKGKGFKNDEPFGMAPIEPRDIVVKVNGVPVDVDVERKGNTFTIKDKKPIAPPLGFKHDFHKQAIEAEKELDKVCKPKKECEHFRRKINNWYPHSLTAVPSVTTIVCLDCGLDLTLDKRQKQKDRQIEIGKEIEKLRIEARTIKNQLKDSN